MCCVDRLNRHLNSGHGDSASTCPSGLDILAEHGRCSPAGDIALSCSSLMNPSMISWRPRWVPILVVVALAAFAVVTVRSLREPVLRTAGWALVVNEPVVSADIIVVSPGSGGARALEAADLVQSGISGARQIRQLRSLGV